MSKWEYLQEGWVKFSRTYCKEGFIDCWMGDQADDPNRDKQNWINLNAFVQYFRLNGEGEWIHGECFDRYFVHELHKYGDQYPAEYVWTVFLNQNMITDVT